MATALPLPPTGTPVYDPQTGQVNLQWANYFNTLENALVLDVAPRDARYWLSTSNSELTNEQNIGSLSTGYLRITTSLGIATPATTATLPAADLSGTIADARLSSNVPLKNATNVFTGSNTFPAGAGASTVVPTGRVFAITAAVPTAGTTEELLASYTIPANTLNADGQALRLVGGLTTAANGNTKIVRVRLGGLTGTILLAYTSTTNAGVIWIDALVTRRTSGTAYGNGLATNGTTLSTTGATATPAWTGTVDLVVTGETASAAGDLTLEQADVVYLG